MVNLLIGIVIGAVLMYIAQRTAGWVGMVISLLETHDWLIKQLVKAHNDACDGDDEETDAVSNGSPYSPSPEHPVGFHIN